MCNCFREDIEQAQKNAYALAKVFTGMAVSIAMISAIVPLRV